MKSPIQNNIFEIVISTTDIGLVQNVIEEASLFDKSCYQLKITTVTTTAEDSQPAKPKRIYKKKVKEVANAEPADEVIAYSEPEEVAEIVYATEIKKKRGRKKKIV